MLSYLIRRTGHAILVLFGVATIVFILVRLSGDPTQLLLAPNAKPEAIEALRAKLGLDQPLLVQYLNFLGSIIHGDLGNSLYFRVPALDLIAGRLPATMYLASVALVFALIVAVPAGVIAAVKRGSFVEGVVQLVVLVGQSTPAFWVGIVLILVFAVGLGWFPTGGMDSFSSVVLPAITLGFYLMAMVARLLRSSMLGVLNEDYVRTARAKGVSRGQVITKHAMRNALLPTVTVIGLEIGSLFGGAVLVENVFAWPGVGSLMVDAIHHRDYPLVQCIVLVLAAIFVLINLLVDLSYTILDPRIRLD